MAIAVRADEVRVLPPASDQELPEVRQVVVDQLVGRNRAQVQRLEIDAVCFLGQALDELPQGSDIQIRSVGIGRCGSEQRLYLLRRQLKNPIRETLNTDEAERQ